MPIGRRREMSASKHTAIARRRTEQSASNSWCCVSSARRCVNAWLLVDARVVDGPMASNRMVVPLSSVKPFFFTGLTKALPCSDTVGAADPGIQYERHMVVHLPLARGLDALRTALLLIGLHHVPQRVISTRLKVFWHNADPIPHQC